ncbi:MAG: hypothetical protein DWQ31_12470 [Planctomycetota bacterium]|nr:MAG: hypothetical protein DWQ31_12470 [Planctomycetota bacterium]REJ89291.1 MAG: hypothetical protein DWQ35_18310 [Planctomycetota bacterium]REK22866.1 MAG: hypothetical protein DWQ42_16275 [Planctomycetota bacterium]REK37434.1 MAG: hypothetical protein DWQ46_22400 [Planctomycetota bacterium]
MEHDEAQAVWRDYYARIRERRVDEAEQLITASRQDGITDQCEVFLDFRHFSNVEADIEQLKVQLAENYEVSVSKYEAKDYWYLDGTTRPVPMAFERDQLLAWVKFMADVAQSYACVFSTWVLTQASTGKQWGNESFEAITD